MISNINGHFGRSRNMVSLTGGATYSYLVHQEGKDNKYISINVSLSLALSVDLFYYYYYFFYFNGEVVIRKIGFP